MHPSTLLLKVARIHPGFAAALAVGWRAIRRKDRSPHWLLLHLQDLAAPEELCSLPVGTTSTIEVPTNGWLLAEYRRWGVYEPATTAICEAILGPGMFAIDVGANAGYFTVLFAEKVGGEGRVVSFEPCRSVYDLLQRNVRRNALQNVRVVHAAVSNSKGRLPLYYATSEVTHSLRQTRFTTGVTETVEATTLDDYAREFGLARVDLLKIDVEGADLHVLEGARMTLAKHRPYVIVEASDSCTSFGYAPEAISQLLEREGYRVLAIDLPDPLAWSGDLQGKAYVNLLGVPAERADRIHGFLDVLARTWHKIAALAPPK